MVTLTGILYAVISLGIIALIVLVLYKKMKSSLNRSFALFLGSLLIWIIFGFISNLTNLPDDVLLLANRGLLSCSGILLASLLIFCSELLELKSRSKTRLIALLLGLIVAAFAFTPWVVDATEKQNNVVAIHFATLSFIYFAIILTMALAVFVMLASARYQPSKLKRQRAFVMLGGLSVSVGLALLTNVVATFVFKDFTFTTLGPFFSVIALSAAGYAIIRHKLFNVRTIIARTTAYVLSLVTIGAIYAVIVYGAIEDLFNLPDTGFGLRFVYILIALALALTFNPIKRFFDRITDKIFFREDYDQQNVLDQVGNIIADDTDLNKLIENSLRVLSDAFHASLTGVAVVDKDGQTYYFNNPVGHKKLTQNIVDQIPDNLADVLINADTALPSSFRNYLEQHHVEVIVPLKTSHNNLGHILLFAKQNEKPYNSKDLNLMTVVSDELGVAIQNSLRLREIKLFNATLQGKVEDATSELRRSNHKLKQLDESKDEFISMASHQLRTPLTTVKGYISMMLDGDVGELTAQQRKVLEEAFSSSQRMVYLIGDFLNVSRLQNGKFELELREVNLPEIVAQEVRQMEDGARSRRMTLHYTQPSDIPVMMLDENKIRQVIMNFIDNAVYYSNPGDSIHISLTHYNGHVSLKVVDHGIGVPSSERHRLFTKFYRASNAKKQRPDGTGIGLFMARKIVTGHGGSIIFESVEGKGSTFGFRLPIKSRD